MAKNETEPKKGTQKEAPVAGKTPEGISFKDLLQYTTGSAAPSEKEFESAMAAKGYRAGDVRKMKRAFREVQSSGKDYYLQEGKGFDVYGGEGQETGSGKAKGNKQGFDLGDTIGLGNNVSLLAGALRNEAGGYKQAQEAKNKLDVSNEQIDGKGPVSEGPEQAFATSMRDLLAASAAGQGSPKTGEDGGGKAAKKGKASAGSQQKVNENEQSQGVGLPPPPNSNPDFDLLKWSPANDYGNPSGTPGEKREKGNHSEAELKQAAADFYWQNPGSDFMTSTGYGMSSLGEMFKDAGKTGLYGLPLMGALTKTPGASKLANRIMTPMALTGVAGQVLGDAINPNEDVDWMTAGTDLAEIALGHTMNKAFAGSPQTLEQQMMGNTPRQAGKITKFSQQAGQQISKRANQAKDAFSTNPFSKFNIKGNQAPFPSPLTPAAIEENFLMNLTDDLGALPMKAKGGILGGPGDGTTPKFKSREEHDAYYTQQLLGKMQQEYPELHQSYQTSMLLGKRADADAALAAAGGLPVYKPEPFTPTNPTNWAALGFSNNAPEGYRYDSGKPDKESITKRRNGGALTKFRQY